MTTDTASLPSSSQTAKPCNADAEAVHQTLEWSAGFAINGKFLSQRTTGVQRVGYELTAAFLKLFPDGVDVPLLLPPNARASTAFPKASPVFRWLKGSMWEQIALPFASRGRTLISLCNIGPLLRRQQVLLVHDVAVYDLPENYSWKYRAWYRTAYAILSRNVSHIVTVSEFSRQRIIAHLGIAESRISVVRNGVDHLDRIESDAGILRRLNLRDDGYVLVVGNLSVGKNLARVLTAANRLSEKHDWQFVVAGGCDLRVFSSTAKLDGDLSKNIIAAGYVSDGELKSLYEHAACFVFPSLYEGFGLPPLEAMYCGCPVIVSREAALPEVCGDAAMYCDAYSADDIASKVTEMMSNRAMRDVWRERGRERARAFRWDDSARQLLDVLQRNVSSGSTRRAAIREG